MRLNTALKYIFIAVIAVFSAALGPFAMAQTATTTPETLKNAIDLKAKELELIANQIRQTADSIYGLQGKKRTLATDIKKFDYSINQVSLGIRSSEVTLEKLSLELQSLNLQSEEMDKSIAEKREAIVQTLKTLQKKDKEGILHMLLKNGSLVEGAFDIQALEDLQDVLLVNVNDLNKLQAELLATIEKTSQKKDAIQTENLNLKNRKTILNDQKLEKNTILSQVKNQESVYQKQLSTLEAQQEAISAEIDKIEEELRLKFDVSLLPQKRSGVFQWPVLMKWQGGTGVVTQHAGEVSYLYKGRPHNGLDIGAPIGTPILASEAGTVVAVDNNGARLQYGRYILIKHPNNLATLYAHLSRQIVVPGQTVTRGQVIGYMGATGYATGSHLHFGVYSATVPISRCATTITLPILCFTSRPPATGQIPIGPYIDPEGYL